MNSATNPFSLLVELFYSAASEGIAKALREQHPAEPIRYPERVPVDVASEITGYTKNSLYQMHSKGKVPGAHKVGGKLMFETAALQEWVANGGRAA